MSTGWVKICGMTSEDAVASAMAAGADAIGFVFAPSVRQVSARRAFELARPARDRVTCIAVAQHPSQALVDEILKVFRPDMLQTDIEDLETLRLPATLPRIPVLRAGATMPNALPAKLLYEGPRSGTGQVSDWHEAASLARQSRLLLAGGLNADNVAAAIASVRPAGVDTSSGVESSPGVKSAVKVAKFVSAARAAFTRMESA